MAEEQQRTITTDVLLEALASDYRQRVLRCLCEHETPMSIADLAREIAVRKHGGDGPEAIEDERKRIHVMLYHSHVPKLADAGLITYDRERAVVDAAPSVDVESILESYSL